MVESVGKENVNVRPERILVLSTVESLSLFPFSFTLPFYTVTLLIHLDDTFLVVVIITSILKKGKVVVTPKGMPLSVILVAMSFLSKQTGTLISSEVKTSY